MLVKLVAADTHLLSIPPDCQLRRAIGEATRLEDLGRDTGDLLDFRVDLVKPGLPRLPLCVMIATDPNFDDGEQAHDVFFGDFHWASKSVVRGAVEPRGLDEVLAADE